MALLDSLMLAQEALPGGFSLDDDTRYWVAIIAIVLATFITEDMTSITVGILIGQGRLDLWVGLSGCFLGIFLGDMGLFLFGTLLRRHLVHLSWVRRWLPERRQQRWRRWFEQYGWAAVIGSRFLPGTRIPAFIGAGLAGGRMSLFLIWIALAGLVWTPLIVCLSIWFGATIAEIFGHSWVTLLVAVIVLLLAVHHLVLLFTREGRSRLRARFSRVVRWEFWPPWLFYSPLVPWLLWLGIRYRGLSTFTAVNPGLVDPTCEGLPKSHVLNLLEDPQILPYVRLDADDTEGAMHQVRQLLMNRGWSFPLILKPDVSSHGAGVRLAQRLEDVREYLDKLHHGVLVQVYHPGPGEASILWCRWPGEERGRILSITHKVFPELVGDGEATLRQLVWRHPRYRMQARRFLQRYIDQDERVLNEGEWFTLARTGTHAQGAMLRDGGYLITPELEQRVDTILRRLDGFHIGRLDVRYRDVAAFRAGKDLAIMELNGLLAEQTSLYDSGRYNLWQAYGILFRQWQRVFRIGARNRADGAMVLGPRALLDLARCLYRQRRVTSLSD